MRKLVNLVTLMWTLLGIVAADVHLQGSSSGRKDFKKGSSRLNQLDTLSNRLRLLVEGNIDSTKLFHFEAKKIGSRPPSCHNKCRNCHPCSPAEVTVPPSNRMKERMRWMEQVGAGKNAVRKEEAPPYYNLTWSCRCRGRYYNP